VFSKQERRHLNLALYDSSILTDDKQSKMYLGNVSQADSSFRRQNNSRYNLDGRFPDQSQKYRPSPLTIKNQSYNPLKKLPNKVSPIDSFKKGKIKVRSILKYKSTRDKSERSKERLGIRQKLKEKRITYDLESNDTLNKL
jgi:hypothetical protein